MNKIETDILIIGRRQRRRDPPLPALLSLAAVPATAVQKQQRQLLPSAKESLLGQGQRSTSMMKLLQC